ncbi:hypothetical protein HDV00_009539 [Rhizophlyctis rosea]|nr:hypothetical protein HDV00_009539 [Rhizophlyctis rosea]
MEAAPHIHATVNNELYAIPVSLSVTMMKVNITTILSLRQKPEYAWMKLPPPLEDWPQEKSWNMTMFNTYLQIMWNEGYYNLWSLPTWWQADTEYAVISGTFYGGTVINAQGRCGLDEAYERALNETFVKWVQYPGLLQERVAPDTVRDLFEAWKLAPKKADPLEEPHFSYWETLWVYRDIKQHGFQWDSGYGDFDYIYPPMSSVKAWGNFAGIPPQSRNPLLAYEALVEVIALNERLQVNQAVNYNTGMGTSAYKDTKNTPEYQSSARQAKIYHLLDRAIFPGYPAAQSPSWQEYFPLNPMALAFDEIRFKVGVVDS